MAVVLADRRAGDTDLVAVRANRDANEVGEVARRAPALLAHLDPALGRDQRRVHVIHQCLRPPLEGSVQRRDGEQARVVAREAAVVRERDLVGPPARQLHREPTELRGQRNVRAERLHVLRADRRDVDRVRDERPVERRGDLLGHDHACAVLRLLRRGG